MSNHVYKLLELTGSSPVSIEDAVSTAIAKASETVRNIHWFTVTETRGHVQEGKIVRVVGLASSVPFVESNPLDPSNRRISIVVLNKESEEQLLDVKTADVDDEQTTEQAVDAAAAAPAGDTPNQPESAQAATRRPPDDQATGSTGS